MYDSHIRFLGALVLLFSLCTGLALISGLPCYKLFAGFFIISYTLLQFAVGLNKNNDEGENI